MISDVLSEAVEKIDKYLSDATYDKAYKGELRQRIVVLRNQMDSMRAELDTPPNKTKTN